MQVKRIEECKEKARIDLFNQFDNVNDVGDHHYAQLKNDETFDDKVSKQIMKEWKILKKGLPETIYVKVYERRIDLLRACIIGAAGTPYHDGLFFFDIKFPANYPAEPPKVHYKSFGLWINPNLEWNGKVCLSLLNTWFGSRYQRWNSEESTILQVLVSIQALILNEKPYFNEPGREKPDQGNPTWKFWEKKSLSYNQQVFVLTCKTMMYVLKRPPMHFEELVSMYFRKRAHAILTACKAYIDGYVKVGGLLPNELSSSSSPNFLVSKKFEEPMGEIYPKLLKSFMKNGSSSSLEHFVEQYKAELEKISLPFQTVQKRKDGLVNMVKKMLGFQKVIRKTRK